MQPPPKWEVVLVYKAMCTGVESLSYFDSKLLLDSGHYTSGHGTRSTSDRDSGNNLYSTGIKPYLNLRLELVVAWDRSARSHPSTL